MSLQRLCGGEDIESKTDIDPRGYVVSPLAGYQRRKFTMTSHLESPLGSLCRPSFAMPLSHCSPVLGDIFDPGNEHAIDLRARWAPGALRCLPG